jgi:DUF4097 and DUF4098 domain-containing protein YvlB
MRKFVSIAVFLLGMSVMASARAQDVNADRTVVKFSDPSRPGLLKVTLMNGRITVKGYSGEEVVIESKSGGNRNRRPSTTSDGLRRIDSGDFGFTVTEENNVMTINSGVFSSGDLEIQAPLKTNLELHGVNGRAIAVDGIEGDIEVTNTNGDVSLNNVAGSIVAHSTNGRLTASLRDVAPDKPTSFTSMNGNLDVTLPASVKANMKMRADNGAVYTDFDIQLRPTAPTVEDSRNQGGRFRLETGKTVAGTINGGGVDFDLRTLNGNIYVRKAK